jgi:hypothetical protein
MPEAVAESVDTGSPAPVSGTISGRLSSAPAPAPLGRTENLDLAEVDDGQGLDEIENLEEPAEREQPEAKPEAKAEPGAEDIEAKLAALGLNQKQHADILALLKEQFSPKQPVQATSAGPDVDQVMQELAAELTKPPQETPKPEQAQQQPLTAAAAPKGFGDIGDQWHSAEEFYKARADADAIADHRTVNDIDQAIFDRRLYGSLGGLQQLVNRWIVDGVKHMVPQNVLEEAQVAWESRVEGTGQEHAEKFLRSKLGEDFAAMLTEDGGKPVEWEGKQMSPVPYNRIVKEHPYIGKIRENHKDPAIAAQMTWAARYGEAYRIYQRQKAQAQTTEKVAKEVAAASAKSGARAERDRQRSSAHIGGRTEGNINGSRELSQDELRRYIGDHLPGAAVRKLRTL